MYRRVLKRAVDFTLAFLGIIVLSPVFLGVGIAVKSGDGGKVFFVQKRVGKSKILFNMYKFRTMKRDTPADRPTHMLQNPHAYITKVGRFLRRTSLDELPQLFNILIGNMSVVGPRPALYNQDDLIALRDMYGANDVRPGLTGWAQINGRDEIPIPVKAKLDGEYVSRMSFLFDVKCFFMTVFKVASKEGIAEGDGK